MPSTANEGSGLLFSIGATNIGSVRSISGPDQSVNPIDVTTGDSPGKWMEFIPGLVDAGEATIELNYDGSSGGVANILQEQLTATAAQALVIQYADHTTPSSSSKFECAGFITGMGDQIPVGERVDRSVTVKFSGQPTYTDLA